MHRSSLAGRFLLLRCKVSYEVWNEIDKKRLEWNRLTLPDGYDVCEVSDLVSAWTCTRQLSTELK